MHDRQSGKRARGARGNCLVRARGILTRLVRRDSDKRIQGAANRLDPLQQRVGNLDGAEVLGGQAGVQLGQGHLVQTTHLDTVTR